MKKFSEFILATEDNSGEGKDRSHLFQRNYGDKKSDQWNKDMKDFNARQKKNPREETPPAFPKGYDFNFDKGTVIKRK